VYIHAVKMNVQIIIMRFVCLFFLVGALVLPCAAVAQSGEIQCDVRIVTEQLTSDARLRLQNFRKAVSDYMNNYKWTNSQEFETDEDRIYMQLQFNFTAADITQTPAQYTAQILVVSQRPIYRSLRPCSMLRMLEPNISFQYDERQSVILHNEQQYTPLGSLLDFYALLVLGLDGDSFDKMGGNPYYDRAIRVKRLAQSQAANSRGWNADDNNRDNRALLMEELVDPRFFPLRDEFYKYHYDGLDMFQKNPEEGRQKIIEAIKKYSELDARFPRSNIIRRFFEAKFLEVGEVFKNGTPAQKQEIFQYLIRVDPSRRSIYEQYLVEGAAAVNPTGQPGTQQPGLQQPGFQQPGQPGQPGANPPGSGK
jgi:hypothetical protein